MLSVLSAAAVLAAPAAEELHRVTGWDGPLPSRQYSGYLDVGPSNRKHLHYWYVESTGRDPADPATPVVLWMNGGPGCSSLDGWYYEHGPFRGAPGNAKALVENPYSWAKVANIIYIEAPVGVGFSYSDAPEVDYKVDDDSTAADNRDAMKVFFEKFAELKAHPFYITGESYGGIYVPTAAEAILKDPSWTGAPLKGIAVGNGCTGIETDLFDEKYSAEFFLGLSLVAPDLKQQIRAHCDLENITPTCDTYLDKMYEGLVDVNVYDVFAQCVNTVPDQLLAADGTPAGLNHQKLPLTRFRQHAKAGKRGPSMCLDSRDASEYWNQPEIPAATNVKPVNFTWTICSTAPGWDYTSTRKNLPRDLYPFLVDQIDVLIYNGDLDGGITYVENEQWTASMGYPVAVPYHPWHYTKRGQPQVGGMAVTYRGKHDFAFVTIKGGRHEVPETAGDQALAMLDAFVNGRRL